MESVPEEIRMMILNHLPNTELINCSLLSKRFNYEARSVMRNRGSLLARSKTLNPCGDMEEFVSMLQQINIIPFTGFHFRMHMNHTPECQPWSAELANRIHKELTTRMLWKNLSLVLECGWWENQNCPALLLAKKIMRDFCGLLENFTIHIEPGEVDLMDQVIQDCQFPRLKILNVGKLAEYVPTEYHNYFIKAMVDRAPNLQELHIEGVKDLIMENVLEGSSALLVIDDYFEPTENISESLVGAIRLKKLMLIVDCGQDFNVERYNQITRILLQASSKTLSSVSIDLEFPFPLICYGFCFENVRELEIVCGKYYQLEYYHPRVLEIVKEFDFTRIFPTLNKVSINGTFAHRSIANPVLDEFVEQANAIWRRPLPDRAINIKNLNLNAVLHGLPFYRKMFPDVESISTSAFEGALSSYVNTWKHWKNLKKLEMKINSSCEGKNLDSVFCGIFPQEVAELRERDDEYLKSVNIVPVMPSITLLKDLRNLNLYWGRGACAPDDKDSTTIFSKVTELLAFARCPNLAVTLKNTVPELPQGLSHLESYVSVEVVPSKQSWQSERYEFQYEFF